MLLFHHFLLFCSFDCQSKHHFFTLRPRFVKHPLHYYQISFIAFRIAVTGNFTLFAEVENHYTVVLRKSLFKIVGNLRCDIFQHPFAVSNFKDRVLQPAAKFAQKFGKPSAKLIIGYIIRNNEHKSNLFFHYKNGVLFY